MIDNEPPAFGFSGIEPGHPYLSQRGIGTEVARYFGAGFYCGPRLDGGAPDDPDS
jgi:hypothetical protein